MRQKLFIFTDWFAPAYKAGGPIQSCTNFALTMANDYKIFVIASNEDLGGPLKDIPSNEWVQFRDEINVIYLSPSKSSYIYYKELFAEKSPDLVYLNSMFSFKYSILPILLLLFNNTTAKFVLAPRGMLHKGAIKFNKYKKVFFLYLFRVTNVFSKMQFHATDTQEKRDILRRLGVNEERITIIPNIPFKSDKPFSQISKIPGSLKLVFISRLSPKKNLTFFLEILSNLKSNSSILLDVYGIDEENYIMSCKTYSDKMPENIKINYKGVIDHNKVQSTLKENHFFILPTLGENFGHSIFEAFAAGRPVIISDQTPWKELKNRKMGWDIGLENKELWVNAIEEAVLMNQSIFDEYCKNSFNYANSFLEKKELKNKYLNLFS